MICKRLINGRLPFDQISVRSQMELSISVWSDRNSGDQLVKVIPNDRSDRSGASHLTKLLGRVSSTGKYRCIRQTEFPKFQTEMFGLSASTGKHCDFGHLALVFIWSCFVFCLLFLLF